MNADTLIEKLRLVEHPEGGRYRETYRSQASVVLDNGDERSTFTTIYYLLRNAEKSHFHRIKSDEVWLFHQGDTLIIKVINSEGELVTQRLGNRLDLDEEPQFVVKANQWFAVSLEKPEGYALVSCLVAPGFDFRDFELAERDALLQSFPNLKGQIESFCLDSSS
ncbi:MAG: cupin domain-containing protein [Bacteroidales bacterium]|nr:cupin domain-containing protein [Bacteroidales bacterium]